MVHLAVVIAKMAEVDVQFLFDFLDVTANRVVGYDAHDSFPAMAEVEVDVGIIMQHWLLVPDVIECGIAVNAIHVPQPLLQQKVSLGAKHLVDEEME